jgi:hypothetical protein
MKTRDITAPRRADALLRSLPRPEDRALFWAPPRGPRRLCVAASVMTFVIAIPVMPGGFGIVALFAAWCFLVWCLCRQVSACVPIVASFQSAGRSSQRDKRRCVDGSSGRGPPTSVDSSKPAIDRHFKTGHHGRGGRDQWSSTSWPPRCASPSTVVRQLRGPNLRMCA